MRGACHSYQGSGVVVRLRKADVRLPGKVNSNSYGARPVHVIITMIKDQQIVNKVVWHANTAARLRHGGSRIVNGPTMHVC